MTAWLLDTNVVSELRKPKPSKRVIAFLEAQSEATLHLSTIKLAEIRFGIARQTDPGLRADLERWLETEVRPLFHRRILDVTEDVILRWRILVEEARQTRYTPPEPDFLIAAIARQHDLTVVTRDVHVFERCGTPVLNPWR